MNTKVRQDAVWQESDRAFSLIEIMVTVALLSFIILGLVVMFSQTQRVFMTSVAQVDTLESGRALSETVSRELLEAAPSYLPIDVYSNAVNFRADFPVEPFLQEFPQDSGAANPVFRTNVLQRVFFITRHGNLLSASGYYVRPDFPGAGVGTLYRFQSNYFAKRFLPAVYQTFLVRPGSNSVARGVLNFRLTPVAPNGFPLMKLPAYRNAFYVTNTAGAAFPVRAVQNTFAELPIAGVPDMVSTTFYSNALPAFVDVEISTLDSRSLQKLNAFGKDNLAAYSKFLGDRLGQIYLFKQRVPLRNVDLSAYQ